MTIIEHILVPTDFSEPSDRALAMAIELARCAMTSQAGVVWLERAMVSD